MDPAWLLFWVFLPNVAPALRVGRYRLLEGVVKFQDLSGSSREGEAYVYRYVAHARTLRLFLFHIWPTP